MVVKKDGRRQPYDRSKLHKGLQRACVKRPVSGDAIDRLLDELERGLVEKPEQDVSSDEIGGRVLTALRALDEVAYVRFASVYRDFQDAREFMTELSELLEERR